MSVHHVCYVWLTDCTSTRDKEHLAAFLTVMYDREEVREQTLDRQTGESILKQRLKFARSTKHWLEGLEDTNPFTTKRTLAECRGVEAGTDGSTLATKHEPKRAAAKHNAARLPFHQAAQTLRNAYRSPRVSDARRKEMKEDEKTLLEGISVVLPSTDGFWVAYGLGSNEHATVLTRPYTTEGTPERSVHALEFEGTPIKFIATQRSRTPDAAEGELGLGTPVQGSHGSRRKKQLVE